MNSTYTVKNGDTLGAIARQNGAKAAEIQALNPIISNPNDIRPGWELKLPATARQTTLPPPMHTDSISSTALEGQPECDEDLVDVAHITGEPDFYVLTDKQSKELKREISAVQKLMDELHQNLAKALPISQCNKLQDPEAICACAGCVKEAWAVKAEGAGLLIRETRPLAAAPLTSANDLQGQLRSLQQVRDWYQHYKPNFFGATQFESNWKSLQDKKTLELDQEINRLRTQLAAQHPPRPGSSSTNAKSAEPDLKQGKGLSGEVQRGKQSKSGLTVVEIILFSDPSRRHYVPVRYRDTTRWSVRVSTSVMAGKPFDKPLAGDLIKDIQKAVGAGRNAGPLGSLELKISSWTSPEDNLLNALHQQVAWTSNQHDAARYAVSSEAHALRFAASASAGVNSWNPREGSIEVGVKGSAAFSLAEASVALNSYFPGQGGYVANMAYRNAEGQEVVHPMGVFRVSGKVELSCFVGAKLQSEAGVKTQYKPTETPAGATALLGTPNMEVGPSGNIGLKCGAFVGAQSGGALSGSFDWVAPDKHGTGKSIVGQANASSNWVKLAEIKVEGNVALGIGGSGEFGLSISKDRLAFNCKGSLVFGPGAGGGFATMVDVEQIGKLALLFCNALADVEYRYLLGVTGEAFSYVAWGLYRVAISPVATVSQTFERGLDEMTIWWGQRIATRVEAEALADYLIAHERDRIMRVKEEDIPLSALPPETVGPMVYLLTEGVAAKGIGSFNEKQEKALIILLSEVRRWRHFIKVLEHCSLDGTKVNAMQSLERINALLNGYEQDQFNRFIDSLAFNNSSDLSTRVAWVPSNAWRKEKVLVAAQNSGQFEGLV